MTTKAGRRRPPQAVQSPQMQPQDVVEQEAEQREPRYPIQQSAAFAGSTLALGSLIDLCAHLGPTGLFVSGLASYVAWRHGPELAAYLRGKLPADPLAFAAAGEPPDPQASGADADAPKGRGRIFWERALGIFPDEDGDEDEEEQASPKEAATEEERATVAPTQASRQAVQARLWAEPDVCGQGAADELLHLGVVLPSGRPLCPHVNRLLGEGLFVAGNMGAGKTNLAALLAEQMGACYVPSIIFDLKREYGSLPGVLPTAIRAGHPRYAGEAGPGYYALTRDTAPAFVASVMGQGFQAVVDLGSYQVIDAMGLIIAEVIDALMAWSQEQPDEDRPPCFVFVDEAHHFLPERVNLTQLDRNIHVRLQKSFFRMCNLGRSYGYTMAFCTQRIANIAKWVANCQVKVIMRHALDIDLDRCCEEVNKTVATREDIERLAPGMGIVIGLCDRQFVAQFDRRASYHPSHTPKVNRAHLRYRDRRLAPRVQPKAALPQPTPQEGEVHETRRLPVTGDLSKAVKPPMAYTPAQRFTAGLSPVLQEAYEAYEDGMTNRELGRKLGISHPTAGKYIELLKAKGMIDSRGRKVTS
ncbi:MAG TPA: DUF87 domain-containing protein [Ktedonobacteraceae bacterium]|nr:DUF87 domain-containing protein [Ktedonobacteraceae bacterium]